MNRATGLLLLGAAILSVALLLEPLATYAIFGSDTGEYYRLTAALLATGHDPLASYGGWGFAYQDFPGIFLLSAGAAGALGVDPLAALETVIPVLAALSIVPLFLLFRRLFPNDRVALLGAALATVAMPRAFSIAHPAPLALGDLFVVAALWMFLEGRTDPRFYLPLSLTAAALVVTHHLSSYFFLVSALGGLLLMELWRPGAWSRRFPLRELLFLGAFAVGLIAFWFDYAHQFGAILEEGIFGIAPGFAGLSAAAVGGVVLAGLLVRLRRARPRRRRPSVRLPSDRSALRDFVLLLVAGLGGALLLVSVALPGTQQRTTVGAVLFFLPLFLLIPFAAGSRRLVTMARTAPFAITWLGAVGASALVGIATQSAVLLPARHAEYLLIPLSFLVALTLGWLIGRLGAARGRRAMWAGAVAAVVLIAANAAIVYPPPADLGGFNEGLTYGDAALWMWIGIGIPGNLTVGSDHRLSSMVFGFDGNNATWDSTPGLFWGSNWSAAAGELSSSRAPHSYFHAINAVAVDSVMRSGTALDPGQLAQPMSPAAIAWFAGPPFVPLYENGAAAVYWVVFPLPASVG